MFLGNIVSNNNHFENDYFKITNNLDDIDRKIPTLIIGWDFSKCIFNDKKLSILDKKISDNIEWTFSKREKRIDYEKDVKKFVEKCILELKKSVKYKYINVLTCKYSDIKNILKKLNSDSVSYIYIYKNSFIYAYLGNTIIGLDLNSIDFINVDRKKIYRNLYGKNNKLIFSDDFVPLIIKENINDNNKIIPLLYSIKENG